MKSVSLGVIDEKLSLSKKMALRQTGDEPVSKLMMGQFSDMFEAPGQDYDLMSNKCTNIYLFRHCIDYDFLNDEIVDISTDSHNWDVYPYGIWQYKVLNIKFISEKQNERQNHMQNVGNVHKHRQKQEIDR